MKTADFFLLSALFFVVGFLGFGFDHITGHRQKKSAHRESILPVRHNGLSLPMVKAQCAAVQNYRQPSMIQAAPRQYRDFRTAGR